MGTEQSAHKYILNLKTGILRLHQDNFHTYYFIVAHSHSHSHDGHGHRDGHGHHQHVDTSGNGFNKAFAIATMANLAFTLVEAGYAIVAHSTSLLATLFFSKVLSM